jgi:hypothetical protein
VWQREQLPGTICVAVSFQSLNGRAVWSACGDSSHFSRFELCRPLGSSTTPGAQKRPVFGARSVTFTSTLCPAVPGSIASV